MNLIAHPPLQMNSIFERRYLASSSQRRPSVLNRVCRRFRPKRNRLIKGSTNLPKGHSNHLWAPSGDASKTPDTFQQKISKVCISSRKAACPIARRAPRLRPANARGRPKSRRDDAHDTRRTHSSIYLKGLILCGGEYRNRTGVHGFAIRCVTTPPTRRLSSGCIELYDRSAFRKARQRGFRG